MNTPPPGQAGQEQKLVSLCMIVGNVAEYIERCITSFAPIADEIILVRAIGSQQPDDTLIIAEAVCGHLGKPYRFQEYQNAPGHEDWPHVDSFAAAREMSFDLASGTYCFWCDTDDILACDPQLIRDHAARGAEAGTPVFVFPYDIFGRGVSVPRERMILRAAKGRWTYPVHECFTFDQLVEGVSDERVIVQHLPKPSKSGSMERNLRILESIPEADLTAGLLYHLHCEQRGAGRIVDAIESAKKALSHSGLGRPEKYELLLNLASMCTRDHLQVGLAYLLQAYATDPNRREALGLLAASSIDAGRPADALSFARQMMATPRPEDWSWNDRAQAYGWIGHDIMQQALRANGLIDEADQYRRDQLQAAGAPRISLLHATRGRARMASATRKAWHDLAEFPERLEHIFAIDEDDEASFALRRFHHVIVPAGGGCVAAWNKAAEISTGDVLIQVSDDFMPPAKWDTQILRRLGDLKLPRVLGVSDGLREDGLLCMAILTRARYDQVGYLFHSRFRSMYSDNWFTIQANRDGVIIGAFDLVFEHMHPLAGKGEMDQTYVESNAPERYEEGARILADLMQVRTWRDIEGFFDYQEFYERVAQRLQNGDTFVEVGVWCGRSINFLATELKRLGKTGVKLVAVDDFSGVPDYDKKSAQIAQHGSLEAAFRANTDACRNLDMIEIVKGKSYQVADRFEMDAVFGVFIDGAHDELSALRDIRAWRNVVHGQGMVAGHDLRAEGVRKALIEEQITVVPACQMNVWIDASRLNPMAPILSILVPAIPERMEQAQSLIKYLNSQAALHGRDGDVEILCFIDNKTRSVGAKRQALQDLARGEYIAFVDDDDSVYQDYIHDLLGATVDRDDVVTFKQSALINGIDGTIIFDANQQLDEPWRPGESARRRPWHVCAWRRQLVQRCRFADCNYGEDRAWVDQAAPLVKTSHHIDDYLHIYRHDAQKTAAPPPRS